MEKASDSGKQTWSDTGSLRTAGGRKYRRHRGWRQLSLLRFAEAVGKRTRGIRGSAR